MRKARHYEGNLYFTRSIEKYSGLNDYFDKHPTKIKIKRRIIRELNRTHNLCEEKNFKNAKDWKYIYISDWHENFIDIIREKYFRRHIYSRKNRTFLIYKPQKNIDINTNSKHFQKVEKVANATLMEKNLKSELKIDKW